MCVYVSGALNVVELEGNSLVGVDPPLFVQPTPQTPTHITGFHCHGVDEGLKLGDHLLNLLVLKSIAIIYWGDEWTHTALDSS